MHIYNSYCSSMLQIPSYVENSWCGSLVVIKLDFWFLNVEVCPKMIIFFVNINKFVTERFFLKKKNTRVFITTWPEKLVVGKKIKLSVDSFTAQTKNKQSPSNLEFTFANVVKILYYTLMLEVKNSQIVLHPPPISSSALVRKVKFDSRIEEGRTIWDFHQGHFERCYSDLSPGQNRGVCRL